MAKIEIDLEKISNLSQEIEILEKRKIAISNELYEKQQFLTRAQSEHDKQIAQKKQEFVSECSAIEQSHKNKEKELSDREATITRREQECEMIHAEIETLKSLQKDIESQKKDNESFKVACLEREKQAELLIEQYTTKLAEVK